MAEANAPDNAYTLDPRFVAIEVFDPLGLRRGFDEVGQVEAIIADPALDRKLRRLVAIIGQPTGCAKCGKPAIYFELTPADDGWKAFFEATGLLPMPNLVALGQCDVHAVTEPPNPVLRLYQPDSEPRESDRKCPQKALLSSVRYRTDRPIAPSDRMT